jgi:hypothetical protein
MSRRGNYHFGKQRQEFFGKIWALPALKVKCADRFYSLLIFSAKFAASGRGCSQVVSFPNLFGKVEECQFTGASQ